MRRWVLLLAFVPKLAFSQGFERWDHGGSLGLMTGFGVEGRTAIGVGQSDTGLRLFPEVGGMLALSTRWQLMAAARLSFLGPLGLSFLAGGRSTFGQRFKTFFDLDLNVHVLPIVTVGPRVAFGVQYELLSVVGVFACAGLQFGVGPAGIRLAPELVVGLQFRSYLLE